LKDRLCKSFSAISDRSAGLGRICARFG